MRHALLTLGCATLALMTASCGSGVLIYDAPGIDSRASYYKGEFDYATRNGAIATRVVGNPFGGAKDAFDARVLALMKHQNRGVPAEFVAIPSERTDPVFRVVVAFNLPDNVSNQWLCEAPDKLSTTPHTGDLKMNAAFCHGDALQSGSWGVAHGLTGADDPKFARLVRGVTNAMTPFDIKEETGMRLRP